MAETEAEEIQATGKTEGWCIKIDTAEGRKGNAP